MSNCVRPLARRSRLGVHPLEDRATPAGLHGLDFHGPTSWAGFFSYFEAWRRHGDHDEPGSLFRAGRGDSDRGEHGGSGSATNGASLSGTVLLDTNGNRTIDAGDTGQAGIEVDLVNSSGTVVAKTTTAADGTYTFKNLAPGTYSIQVAPDSSYKVIPPSVGTASGSANPSWAAIDGVSLAKGASGTGYNFGLWQAGV